ncbi:MAG TPA: AMP-binding protein, partial [Chloroflexota bacterium]
MAEMVIPERFNAAAYFVDRNLDEGRGDNVAVIYGDQEVTYSQVAEKVNATGHALRGLGVEMENRIVLLLLDSPTFVYSFFGGMKIGAVPVPLNTNLTSDDYWRVLEDTRARILIISEALLPAVEPILSGLHDLRHVVVDGKENGHQSFDALLQGCPTELEAASTSKDDAAFWLYTSGTTGYSLG